MELPNYENLPFYDTDDWNDLEDRQQQFEVSKDFETTEQYIEIKELDYLYNYLTQIEVNEGCRSFSTDGEPRTISQIYPFCKTVNTKIETQKIGNIYDCLNGRFFIRFVGSEFGVTVSESELELIVHRADCDVKELKQEVLAYA